MFLAVLILPLVDRAIFPHLKTKAVVLVVLPLARVLRSIGVSVRTCTMHASILPVADIDVSFGLNLASHAILHVIKPEPLVYASILEHQFSLAVPRAFYPL